MKSSLAARVVFLLASCVATAGTAKPGNHEYAFALGVLWRVQDNVCPGVTFDATALVRTMSPRGMSVAAARKTYRKDFEKGFATAGEAISGRSFKAYCDFWVVGFFGGTRDIFGNTKSVPAEPAPGLLIRR